MILRLLCILGLLLLMAGAYLVMIVLFAFTNPDAQVRNLEDPGPKDQTTQRHGTQIAGGTPLTQYVIWYIRNGIGK